MRIPAANLKPLEDAATGTPHQITYVADALTDEPGLGKAIEAGLIMRELKLRARNRYEEVKSWFVEIRSKANLEMSHV